MEQEPFKMREKQYRIWQAQASARELLGRLEALQKDKFGALSDEIAVVKSVLVRLDLEQENNKVNACLGRGWVDGTSALDQVVCDCRCMSSKTVTKNIALTR